jgi:hypothetical protein
VRQRLAARDSSPGGCRKPGSNAAIGQKAGGDYAYRQNPRPDARASLQFLGDMPWVSRATAICPTLAMWRVTAAMSITGYTPRSARFSAYSSRFHRSVWRSVVRKPDLSFGDSRRNVEHHDPSIDYYLSQVRHRKKRNDADRRVPVFLRVHWLRHQTPARARRLLRLLLLSVGALSANAGQTRVRFGERHHSQCLSLALSG